MIHQLNDKVFILATKVNGTYTVMDSIKGLTMASTKESNAKSFYLKSLPPLLQKNPVVHQALNQLFSERNGFTSYELKQRVIAISNLHYVLQRKGIALEAYYN